MSAISESQYDTARIYFHFSFGEIDEDLSAEQTYFCIGDVIARQFEVCNDTVLVTYRRADQTFALNFVGLGEIPDTGCALTIGDEVALVWRDAYRSAGVNDKRDPIINNVLKDPWIFQGIDKGTPLVIVPCLADGKRYVSLFIVLTAITKRDCAEETDGHNLTRNVVADNIVDEVVPSWHGPRFPVSHQSRWVEGEHAGLGKRT